MRFYLSVFLLNIVLTPLAYATVLESKIYMPTNTVPQHLFALNPATVLPKGFAIGYDDMYRLVSLKQTRDGNGDFRTIKNEIENDSRHLAIVNRFGGSVALGLYGGYDRERVNTNDDASRLYDDETADESNVRKEVSALFNIEFTPGMRIGLEYNQVIFKNRVIGSTGIQRSHAEEIKGTSAALTAGGFLGSGAMGFGAFYRIPARGKASVFGEDKITSDPGILAASMHYEFSHEFRLGIAVFKWLYEKDELNDSTTNHFQENYFMKGLSTEALLFKTESVFAGFDYVLTSSTLCQFALGYDHVQFSSDGTALSTTNNTGAFSNPNVRLGVALTQANASAALNAQYELRSTSFTQNNTSIKHSGSELTLNAAVTLNL